MSCNSIETCASYADMLALRRPLLTAVLCCAGLWLMEASDVRAASFDCAKAQRPLEKVICNDPKLNATDESLGRVYRATLAKLPPTATGELRSDQVQWLAWVQEVCQADVAGRAAAAIAQCMEPVYGKRAKLLINAVARRDETAFLTRTRYIAAPEPKGDALGAPDFPGFGTLQASWPESTDTDSAWKAWNDAVETQAYPAEEGRAARQGASRKELRWTTDLAQGQDSEVVVQLKSIEHGRVTTTASWSTMGHGAAHPNEAFVTMTWLLASRRQLRPGDVFAPGSPWKAGVAAICWEQILKSRSRDALYQEVTGPGAKPLQDDIDDVSNWTLEGDGLHISYPEYSISPRFSPIDDAVIPWAQLKPLLTPGFVAP